MKFVIMAVLFLLTWDCYSQDCELPCLQLKIKGNQVEVKLDSIWSYRVSYTLTNCSKADFKIDTLDLPIYSDDNDMCLGYSDAISFRIYYYNEKEIWELYSYNKADIDNQLIDFTTSTSKLLKYNESYQFNFFLFHYYILNHKGKYRIYASYRKALPDKQGYYIQYSNNYVEIIVK